MLPDKTAFSGCTLCLQQGGGKPFVVSKSRNGGCVKVDVGCRGRKKLPFNSIQTGIDQQCKCQIGIGGRVGGTQFCAAMGATPVIAVDPVKEKRERALQLGADYALDPFAPDFVETVRELTDGRMINAAVEVTGKGQGLDMVLDIMARHGRVSLLGCTRNSEFTIDYYRKVHYPGIELIGAHTGTRPENDSRPGFWCYRDDYAAMFRLIHYGKVNFKEMIAKIYPVSETTQVYDRLANDYRNFPAGVLLDWREA